MSIYKGLRYYKYVYEDWEQPVLSANGTMGGDSFAVEGSSITTGSAYYVINANNTSNTHFGASSFYYTFYSPNKLNVTKLQWVVYDANRNPVDSTILASNNGIDWVTIVENVTNDAGNSTIIDLSNNKEFYNYYKWQVNSVNTGNGNCTHIYITAQEAVPYLINLDGEDVYEAWEQPVLTANGVMGGESFAVYTPNTIDKYGPVYNAFNEGASIPHIYDELPVSILFYNPKPLKIKSISLKQYEAAYWVKGVFQGCNDNSSWVDIKAIDFSGTSITFDVNSDIAYKYHRFYITSSYSNDTLIGHIKITAQELVAIGGTKEDADYGIPIKIKDSGRGVFVGSKNTNCLTYTPKHVDVELNPLNVNVTGTWGVIADGVAKGFTAANYLSLPTLFDISKGEAWEFVFKFNTDSPSTQQTLLGSAGSRSYNPRIGLLNGIVRLMLSNSTSSSNVVDIRSVTSISANVDYWVKAEFTGTAYNLYLSTDGVIYNLEATKETTAVFTATYQLSQIGYHYDSGSGAGFPFKGSIDLSQSYININGERWWSGDSYTKVGSWIDNGVVGSFTTANYLTLSETYASAESWEDVICFTTGSDISTNQSVRCNKVAYWGYGVGVLSGNLWIGLSNSTGKFSITENTSVALQTNQRYYVKTVFNGSSYVCDYSTNGKDWTNIFTIESSTQISNATPRLGINDATANPFKGTIDLTQSYIKINDEIWWQGGTGDVTLKQGSKVFVPNGFVKENKYYKDIVTTKYWKEITTGSKELVYACYYGHDTHNYWYAKAPIGSDLTVYVYNNGALADSYTQLSKEGQLSFTKVSEETAESYLVMTMHFTRKREYDLYKDTTVTEIVEGTPDDYTYTTEETVTVEVSANDDWTRVEQINTTTKVFNELVINNDISAQSFANSEQVVCYNPETNRLCFVENDVYDTDNNVMNDNCSLPVARCTANGVSVTSIDETFDWCGRIGNTAFVLPNVKGFIAKGYKDTGTYDSTEFTVNKVLTADLDTVTDRSLLLSADKLDYVESNYNKADNLLYDTDGEVINAVECGKVTSDGTAITDLTPYTTKPLTTAIPIKFIYSGSQLVYKWEPYEPNTVLLYGANTGTKTYILDAGLYQCCVVGGGWANRDNWSNAGGAAVEIQFRLTEKATVVVYSGGLGHTAYLNIDGARVATANTAASQNSGGSYSIDTASPYYVSTIVARNGGGANLSVAGSVSPYGGWGAGTSAGGVRLEYITY